MKISTLILIAFGIFIIWLGSGQFIWHQFNDNFGRAGETGNIFVPIGALFTGLTLPGIIYTIFLQQKQIEEQSKALRIDLEKEVFLKGYEHSLKQVLILDEKVSEGFWIYLDREKLKNNNEITNARKKLLDLRRLIFDSVSLVDGDVISKALNLSIAYDSLLEKKETDIYNNLARNDYYQKLSDSISTKLDDFKKSIERKYKFSSGEKFLENLEKIMESFKKNST